MEELLYAFYLMTSHHWYISLPRITYFAKCTEQVLHRYTARNSNAKFSISYVYLLQHLVNIIFLLLCISVVENG